MYYTYYISPAAHCIIHFIQTFYTIQQGSLCDPVSYWLDSDQYPALVPLPGFILKIKPLSADLRGNPFENGRSVYFDAPAWA